MMPVPSIAGDVAAENSRREPPTPHVSVLLPEGLNANSGVASRAWQLNRDQLHYLSLCSAKLLIAIANQRQPEFVMSQESLVDRSGLSARTVSRALEELRDNQLIQTFEARDGHGHVSGPRIRTLPVPSRVLDRRARPFASLEVFLMPLLVVLIAIAVLMVPGIAALGLVWLSDRTGATVSLVTGRSTLADTLTSMSAALPAGAVVLATSGLDRPLAAVLSGVILVVGVGSLGCHMLLSLLHLFGNSGLDRLIGAIFVVEYDARERERFQERCPPVFTARIVYGFTTQYGGGFSNKPLAWVLDRIQEWGVPIVQSAEEVLDRFLRRNLGRTPQLVWVFATLGGQAPLILPVLDSFQRQHKGAALTVVATALLRAVRLRERLLDLQPALVQRGVAGIIVIDNLGVDPTTADYALAALPLGLSLAAAFADQPAALNNVLVLALNETADGILIFQVAATTAIAWAATDTAGPRYYTFPDLLTTPIHRLLDQFAAGSGQWSADLPPLRAGHVDLRPRHGERDTGGAQSCAGRGKRRP